MGIFRIPERIIRDWPLFARSILEDKLIVRAESKFAYDAIEYIAYCEGFEETHNCVEPPYYDLQFVYVERIIKDPNDPKIVNKIPVPADWSLVKCDL